MNIKISSHNQIECIVYHLTRVPLRQDITLLSLRMGVCRSCICSSTILIILIPVASNGINDRQLEASLRYYARRGELSVPLQGSLCVPSIQLTQSKQRDFVIYLIDFRQHQSRYRTVLLTLNKEYHLSCKHKLKTNISEDTLR